MKLIHGTVIKLLIKLLVKLKSSSCILIDFYNKYVKI